MRLRDKIRYAQTLADFVNLKSKDETAFRLRECEGSASEDPFVPSNWFDYRPTESDGKPSDKKQWEFNQEMLREAWRNEFRVGQFELMRLQTSVFDPNDLTAVMLGASQRPRYATLTELPEEMYPYQQAVMFLVEENWRAMRCKRCKTPFAATHNRARYCSTENEEGQTCASLARADDQKRDRGEHREERNERRRKKYAAERRK